MMRVEEVNGSIRRGGVSSVPMEIIEEILLKIASPKPLMRFKCVCKSWLSLISDSRFAAMHLRLHPSVTSSSLSVLVFRLPHTTEYSLNDAIFSVHDEDIGGPPVYSDSEELLRAGGLRPCYKGFPVDGQRRGYVLGSCNGIVCLYSTQNPCDDMCNLNHLVHLWNPTTRELKTLPHNPWSLPSFRFNNLFEFFYESSSPLMDDYKVLSVCRCDHVSKLVRYGVCIYSLASNSWRKIDDDAHIFPVGSVECNSHLTNWSSSGVVNGQYLHWSVEVKHQNKPSPECSIVCFDLKREVFELINPPAVLKYRHGKGRDEIKLGKLFDCLTLLQNFYSSVHVWVMKQHGVVASWTKLFTVNTSVLLALSVLDTSGKLVMEGDYEGGMCWFDLKSSNPNLGTILYTSIAFDYHVISHVQTIFPIKASKKFSMRTL